MHWGAITAGATVLVFLALSGCSDDSEIASNGATGATGVAGTTADPPAHSRDGRNRSRGPIAAVEGYYDLLNAGRYDQAWEALPSAVQAEVGGFDEWKAGYAT